MVDPQRDACNAGMRFACRTPPRTRTVRYLGERRTGSYAGQSWADARGDFAGSVAPPQEKAAACGLVSDIVADWRSDACRARYGTLAVCCAFSIFASSPSGGQNGMYRLRFLERAALPNIDERLLVVRRVFGREGFDGRGKSPR
jgi:hypothetical protein